MSLMLDTHSAGACVLICHKCCPCCVGISDDLSWTANIFNPCQVSYDMTAIWSLVNIFRVHIFIHFIVSHAYAHERNTGKCHFRRNNTYYFISVNWVCMCLMRMMAHNGSHYYEMNDYSINFTLIKLMS